jgi:hypothetical protein
MIVKGLSLLIPENHIETAPFLKEGDFGAIRKTKQKAPEIKGI